jgi:hypothetical protein
MKFFWFWVRSCISFACLCLAVSFQSFAGSGVIAETLAGRLTAGCGIAAVAVWLVRRRQEGT